MIQSMTGYGKHAIQLATKKITVELKSLNSKNLDITARLPQAYREHELTYRNTLSKTLKRGKVDFSLSVEFTGSEASATINQAVVKKYMQELETLASGDDVKLLELALRMPDTLSTLTESIATEELLAINKAIENALAAIVSFRTTEGKVLETDFLKRINAINQLLEQTKALDKERINGIRTKLEKAMADLKTDVDANRFEQELIYYLEKYDITEEKVRLANHLDYFTSTLQSADSNGKKLGFICQEIGREINTLGSKANYAPLQQLVVQMKDELEKIKEQLLNVL